MKFTRSIYRLCPPLTRRPEVVYISDENTNHDFAEALNVLKGLVVILPHPFRSFAVDRMNSIPNKCWCGYHEHNGIHHVVVIQPEPMDVEYNRVVVSGEPESLVNNMVDWRPLADKIIFNQKEQ